MKLTNLYSCVGPPIIHIRLDNLTGLDSREAKKFDPHKIQFLNWKMGKMEKMEKSRT